MKIKDIIQNVLLIFFAPIVIGLCGAILITPHESNESIEQTKSEFHQRFEALNEKNRIGNMRKELYQRGLFNRATNVAINAVKEALFLSESAHFSSINVDFIISKGVFYVQGDVDSLNASGKLIRGRFERYVGLSGEQLTDITNLLNEKERAAFVMALGNETKEEAIWLKKYNKLMDEWLKTFDR